MLKIIEIFEVNSLVFASFLYKIEKNSKNKFMKKEEFLYKTEKNGKVSQQIIQKW